LRGSFIPPRPQRDLRELVRHRGNLVANRARAVNELHKILESTNIKLGNVASDLTGVSATAMLKALVEGQTDPIVLAELAKGRLRQKKVQLQQALPGTLRPHHPLMISRLLTDLDFFEEQIAEVSQAIEERVRDHQEVIDRLDEIPGVNQRVGEVIVAEIGTYMSHFPTENGNMAKHKTYFSLVNEMAQAAYEEEGASYHPVVAVSLEMPGALDIVGNTAGGSDYDASLGYVDIWGINHYPGLTFGDWLTRYAAKTSKPLLITEYGVDAWNDAVGTEQEQAQAEWDLSLWREMSASSVCIGGSVMAYSDDRIPHDRLLLVPAVRTLKVMGRHLRHISSFQSERGESRAVVSRPVNSIVRLDYEAHFNSSFLWFRAQSRR
jgi:hypothetical protein